MFQPAAARVWAVARPIPRLDAAPVTTAVLSVTDMVVLSGWGRSGSECGWRAGGGTAAGPGGWLRQAVAGVGSAAQGAWAPPPSSVLTLVTTASVDRP